MLDEPRGTSPMGTRAVTARPAAHL
jgi:hypothetical protein